MSSQTDNRLLQISNELKQAVARSCDSLIADYRQGSISQSEYVRRIIEAIRFAVKDLHGITDTHIAAMFDAYYSVLPPEAGVLGPNEVEAQSPARADAPELVEDIQTDRNSSTSENNPSSEPSRMYNAAIPSQAVREADGLQIAGRGFMGVA
ncbi:hypothetical protein PENSPDRAFT_670080 [Peniophora sp. CONT]|nr:hypothetical protein PENSPDRAFT_670080 [Peniophora sp. CONT]